MKEFHFAGTPKGKKKNLNGEEIFNEACKSMGDSSEQMRWNSNGQTDFSLTTLDHFMLKRHIIAESQHNR